MSNWIMASGNWSKYDNFDGKTVTPFDTSASSHYWFQVKKPAMYDVNWLATRCTMH